tara:strand:- start:19224 stop:19460 length:237 start_codon:yes stop_codon:yes gene_type:complete
MHVHGSIVVVSTLYFRRMRYETLLIVHIIMAVFVIAGSWYHVELLFKRKLGYEHWLYAAWHQSHFAVHCVPFECQAIL